MSAPLIGHVDVDAFFAAVEQRDKPSLRGRPVVVGGIGPRGVVATASYEARAFGVHSAMPMAEARRRCPHAAVLAGRFDVYRQVSDQVMGVLAGMSARIEPVSLDEAYVELDTEGSAGTVAEVVAAMRREIEQRTGMTASVGVGSTKLVAKIASDLAKPDGSLFVDAGAEQAFLDPLPVRRLPGLGPATESRLARLGIGSVAQLRGLSLSEVVGLLGEAHGSMLWNLAHGVDPRRVEPVHEVKSVSTEETFDHDLTDPVLVQAVLDRLVQAVVRRLRAAGTSGRTVTLKARYPDFTTLTRSATLPGPTDEPGVLTRTSRTLLGEVELARGVRLLGVGVSGLTPWVQQDLFEGPAEPDPGPAPRPDVAAGVDGPSRDRQWRPGLDVVHDDLGRGWVWGSGRGRVTVRFETRQTLPGPVHTFDADDPRLRRVDLTDVPEAPPPRPDEDLPLHPGGR